MTRTSMRLASLVLALLLVLLTAATALAAEQTITVTMKVKVPIYGKTAMGSLVLHNTGTPDNIDITWSFTGTVNGKKASASGKARASWDPNTKTYKGWITRIDSWSMGPLPRTDIGEDEYITLNDEGNQVAKVTFETDRVGRMSTLLSYTGIDTIPAPFGSDLAISVTNAHGSDVKDLPRTGEAPLDLSLAPFALIALGCALLGVTRIGRSRPRARG